MSLTTLTQKVTQDPNFIQFVQAFNRDQNLTDNDYQWNLTKALPSLPVSLKNIPEEIKLHGLHIARLVLPSIGLLYKPAGRAISFGFAGWGLASSVITFLDKEGSKAYVWNVVKAGAELVGTLKGLKTGLIVHTGMDMVENLLDFRTIKQLSDIPAKMVPVVSNGLYLITLLAFSQKAVAAARTASLAFQSLHALYKAYDAAKKNTSESWVNIKTFDTAAYTISAAIYATRAYSAYQEYQKLQKVVQEVVGRVFVIMRPASKRDKTEGGTGGLTQNGLGRAEKAAAAIEQIRAEFDKDGVIIVTSTDPHHAQTGQIIGDKLKAPVSQNGQLRERTATGWLTISDSKVRRADPGYIAFNTLPDEQKFATRPTPDTESQKELYYRLDVAIRQILADNPDTNKLVVMVSGGTIIQDWIKQIVTNPDIIILPAGANMTKSLGDAEAMVVQMAADKFGQLKVWQLDRQSRESREPGAVPSKRYRAIPQPQPGEAQMPAPDLRPLDGAKVKGSNNGGQTPPPAVV